MKKQLLYMAFLFFFGFFTINCGGSESTENEEINEENIEAGEGILDADPDFEYNEDMIEAKFEYAQCLEGECEYSFRTKDDELIHFHYNAIEPLKQPGACQIDYEFFDHEELEPNKTFIGKTFVINYIILKDYNVITKIEMK